MSANLTNVNVKLKQLQQKLVSTLVVLRLAQLSPRLFRHIFIENGQINCFHFLGGRLRVIYTSDTLFLFRILGGGLLSAWILVRRFAQTLKAQRTHIIQNLFHGALIIFLLFHFV